MRGDLLPAKTGQEMSDNALKDGVSLGRTPRPYKSRNPDILMVVPGFLVSRSEGRPSGLSDYAPAGQMRIRLPLAVFPL